MAERVLLLAKTQRPQRYMVALRSLREPSQPLRELSDPMKMLTWPLFSLMAGLLYAVAPDTRGNEVIDRYLNQSARQDAVLSMVVDYKEGKKEPVRLEFTWMRKVNHGLASHLLRMEAPPSEKGKLLLVHEKPDGGADYVTYRPNSALKKKVRVSGARHYRYKGLSISVQELIGGELLKYMHQWKGIEKLNGVSCHVVENRLRPMFRFDSSFPKTILYIQEDNGMPLKWELFGKANELEKIIFIEEVKKIDGFHIISRARVEDLKKRGQLVLRLKEAHYHPDLKDYLFSEEYLKQNSR